MAVTLSATVIDGKAVAAEVRARVAGEVKGLAAELGRPPGLATVLVGDDPASAIYVRRKREACEEVGIRSFHHEPPGDDRPGGAAGARRRARTATTRSTESWCSCRCPTGLDADAVIDSLPRRRTWTA